MLPIPQIVIGGIVLVFLLKALDKVKSSRSIVDEISNSPYVKYNQPQIMRSASKAVKIKDNVSSFSYKNFH